MSFMNSKKAGFKNMTSMLKTGGGAFFAVTCGSSVFTSQTQNGKIAAGFFCFVCILIFISGIRARANLKKVYLIDSLISSAQLGSVSFSQLSEATGIREKRLVKLMKKFIRKKFFLNCEISSDENPQLVLQSVERETVFLECPECGSTFSAEAGSVARCPECASIINI